MVDDSPSRQLQFSELYGGEEKKKKKKKKKITCGQDIPLKWFWKNTDNTITNSFVAPSNLKQKQAVNL